MSNPLFATPPPRREAEPPPPPPRCAYPLDDGFPFPARCAVAGRVKVGIGRPQDGLVRGGMCGRHAAELVRVLVEEGTPAAIVEAS